MDKLMEAALKLYEPPFKYHCTYIFDAKHNTVMNVDQLKGSELILRGWGRIKGMDSAEDIHDALGEHVAKALTEYWGRNG